MDNEQIELLKKIQIHEFSTHELALFLDTHPDNGAALKDYNRHAQELMELKHRYIQKYGPLAHHDPSEGCWKWIDEPWPWEIDYEGGTN